MDKNISIFNLTSEWLYFSTSADCSRPHVSFTKDNKNVRYMPIGTDLSSAEITCSAAVYNGSNQVAQNIVVTFGGKNLVKNQDYTIISNTGGTNAGNYPIVIKGIGDYDGECTGTFVISKANPTISATPGAKSGLSYNGSNQTLLSGGTATPTGTFTYSTGKNAGSYDATWTFTPNDTTNYNTSGGTVSASIAKATPTVSTTPTAKTGLVYNGSAQTLLQGGSATPAGSFSYSTGTDAGSYTATWTYIPTDTANYNTKTGNVSASIAKATPTISANPAAKSGLVYNGSAQNLLSGGTASVLGSWSYTTGTNAGSYNASWTFTPIDSTNYNTVNSTSTISASIAKATGYVNISGTYYSYNGNARSLASVNSNTGTMHYKLGSGSWGTSIPTATSRGTYTVYWYMDESTNYTSIASASSRYVSSEIGKAEPTITSTPRARTGLVYNGGSQTLLSGGSANVSGSFSYSTGTNAGSYNATWTFNPTDSTNYSSKSGTVSASIGKAGQSAPTAYGATTTYGNTATATASGGGGVGSIEWSNGNTRTATGTTETYARWSGNDNYNASSWSNAAYLTVDKATPEITVWPNKCGGLVYNGSEQALLSGGSASVAGSWYYTTSTPAGFHWASFTFTPNDTTNYNEVIVNNYDRVNIAKANRTLSWLSETSSMKVGETRTLSAIASAGSGAITYTSGNGSIAPIVNGTTLRAAGTGSTTITATITGDSNYNNASTSFSLTIKGGAKVNFSIPNGQSSPQFIFYTASNISILTLSRYTSSQTIDVTFNSGTATYIVMSANMGTIKSFAILSYDRQYILNKTTITNNDYMVINLTRTFSGDDYNNNSRTLYIECYTS